MTARTRDSVSPVGRIAIIVVVSAAALAFLVFLLTRPPRPLDSDQRPFGAPGTTDSSARLPTESLPER